MKNIYLAIALSVLSLFCFTASGNVRGAILETWDGKSMKWESGDGSESNPYIIDNPSHLAWLAKEVADGKTFEGVCFLLNADLDMGAAELGKEAGNFSPIGLYDKGVEGGTNKPFDYSKRFEGSFNGNHHVIRNLYISYNDEESKTIGGHGLFGCIGPKGDVINLTLSGDCTVEGGNSGGSIVSVLEGALLNCRSEATVNGAMIIGGLAGSVLGGKIDRCSFAGKIKGLTTVGGIAGTIDKNETSGEIPSITNTYANAKIIATGLYPAGFAGMLGIGKLQNCYATGTIAGDGQPGNDPMFTGGFFGGLYDVSLKDNQEIFNCYYDGERLKQTAASNDGDLKGIEKKPTAEMKSTAFVALLGTEYAADTKAINEGYPVLTANMSVANEKIYTDGISVLQIGRFVKIRSGEEVVVHVYSIAGDKIITSVSKDLELPCAGVYVLGVASSRGHKVFKVVVE